MPTNEPLSFVPHATSEPVVPDVIPESVTSVVLRRYSVSLQDFPSLSFEAASIEEAERLYRRETGVISSPHPLRIAEVRGD